MRRSRTSLLILGVIFGWAVGVSTWVVARGTPAEQDFAAAHLARIGEAVVCKEGRRDDACRRFWPTGLLPSERIAIYHTSPDYSATVTAVELMVTFSASMMLNIVFVTLLLRRRRPAPAALAGAQIVSAADLRREILNRKSGS